MPIHCQFDLMSFQEVVNSSPSQAQPLQTKSLVILTMV